MTKQDILEEFNEEVPGTRKMLERVPFEKFDFKPVPKAMALGQLAVMISTMPGWFMGIINEDFIDLSSLKQPPKPKDAKELVATFDKGVTEVQKALADMNEKSLAGMWELRMNGNATMTLPRRVVLSQTVRHLVHHRAQLGVYFKIVGVPHPAIYGPSGDER